eukprot:CAMPEP_0172731322 /NCGR_PEP_ID=MMETSP1074-20121228/100977_1 /TAXON_ID=2916 /ORGANISM="Ceratium fusus, Strain PA161109" /LENGTH=32 /DNA_ID= /DNA_START= /DNA_END= /DNA_ORIENTATION=
MNLTPDGNLQHRLLAVLLSGIPAQVEGRIVAL